MRAIQALKNSKIRVPSLPGGAPYRVLYKIGANLSELSLVFAPSKRP